MLSARSGDRLIEIARELAHVRVETVTADLSRPDGVHTIATAVTQTGMDVDILMNNAGAGLHGPFAQTPLDRELELVQLNVASLLALTKHFLPGMVARRRGHIVNVASVAAFLPGPYQSVYYASKAFVLSFSEALAEELRDTGVLVSAVCPGPTTTGFHAAAGVRRARPLRAGLFMDPAVVADVAMNALARHRRLVIPGWRNRLMVGALRLAPRQVVARISANASVPADRSD